MDKVVMLGSAVSNVLYHMMVFMCSYPVVVVVVLTLTRKIKSVVTGQAPVTLELRNTPGKTHTTQGGTRMYHS